MSGGGLVYRLDGRIAVAGAEQGTLLHRAGTDNDNDTMFHRLMKPYQT